MEKSNEKIEDTEAASTEEAIVEVKETPEEEDQDIQVEASVPSTVDVDKNADQLIDEARGMVQQSDHEAKDCMEILDEDIQAFEDAKAKVLGGTAQRTDALLREVGFEADNIHDIGEEGVKFASEDPIAPMQVKSLSSGKFAAFILALILGVAAAIAWIYVATEKLEMTLDVSKIPDEEFINKVLSWIGGGITGGEGNPMIGIVILAGTALIVMWAVYSMRVYMREVSNQKLAQKVHDDAQFYCTKKEECKKEMEIVSAHIHKVIESLKTYDVYFYELDAKLQRIIYLEGKIPFAEYHNKSKENMKHANLLVKGLDGLLSTPMAGENGSLSSEADNVLKKSNRTLEMYQENLYS